MQTAKFHIPDLSCENCEKTILTKLSEHPEVQDPQIDVPTKTLTVGFDPEATCEEHIKDWVKEAGYTVESIS